MKTYSDGKIKITSNSASIIGVGTLFAANVTAGAYLTILGVSKPYQIGQVVDDTHLLLVEPIPGVEGNVISNIVYVISDDYGGGIGLPCPGPADTTPHQLVNRSLKLIDTFLPH